ncbi:hypothetical protein NIES39_O00990 [Arthrospira platensis NIES-39]|nr:hypothetical protein NIES39_O00990 [Arthrospira platensis NIES-39]
MKNSHEPEKHLPQQPVDGVPTGEVVLTPSPFHSATWQILSSPNPIQAEGKPR